MPPRAWTEDEREMLIAHQGQPAREVAALLDWTVRAADRIRSQLIATGRIAAKLKHPRKRAE